MFWVHSGVHDPNGINGGQTDHVDLQTQKGRVLALSVHDLVGTYRLFSLGNICMAISTGRHQRRVCMPHSSMLASSNLWDDY
jgi:hypothetical protein